jgi:hypothetical protein
MRTIFDPTGFRTLVRNRFIAQVFGKESSLGGGWRNTEDARRLLNTRTIQLAVCVDEERDVTLLSGYAAYKFGYRSWMINTYSELLTTSAPVWANNQHTFLLRDVDLRFPDIVSDEDEVSIRQALKDITSPIWAALLLRGSQVIVRVLSQDKQIESGAPGRAKDYTDEEYGLGQKSEDGRIKYLGLSKPVFSLYDIGRVLAWFDLGDGDRRNWRIREYGRWWHRRDGQPVWSLCSRLPQVRDMTAGEGHGARYTNLRIATDLICQARRCRQKEEVTGSIVSAILGDEAYSLLLGMSRNTALEAVRAINLADASVESASIGVAHSLRIADRRCDLEGLTAALNLGDARYNFLSQLWAELRLVYRDGEEFEASEEANFESLANTRWIWRRRRYGDRALSVRVKRWVLLPARSFTALVLLFMAWSMVLTCVHCADQVWLHGWTLSLTRAGVVNFVDTFDRVIVSICRGEALNAEGLLGFVQGSALYRLANSAGALSSVVFIGFLASLLFRKVMRS